MSQEVDEALNFLVTSKKNDIKIKSDYEAYAFLLDCIADCDNNAEACSNQLQEYWKHVRNQDKLPEKMWPLKDLCQDSYILLDSVLRLCAMIEMSIQSMCERDDD